MRPEDLVLHQRHIRRQHHQALRLHILILLGPIPLPPPPLLIQQQAEVIIANDRGRKGPRAVKAGAIGVAPPQSMRAAQRYNLAVVEPHAPEDRAQVILPLGAVRESSVGRAEADVAIGAPGPPGHRGALHLLDGCHARERPQVRVGDPGELLLDRFQEVAGGFQAGVGAVVAFGGEAHRGAVGAAGVGGGVVGAAAVPGEADDDRAVGAIVVVVLLFKALRDCVVDGLVVFLCRSEDARCLA